MSAAAYHSAFTATEGPEGSTVLRCETCNRIVIVWPSGVYEVMIQGDQDAVHDWAAPGMEVDVTIHDAPLDWRDRIALIMRAAKP